MVLTDHKNLTRDALGLTSDRGYQWRLLLEEYAPKIIYIKGIHNTVVDALSQLECNPKLNPTNDYTPTMLSVSMKEESVQRWKSFLHHWQSYNEINAHTQALCIPIDKVFANCSKEDKIYPLTTAEIAKAQWANTTLKHLFKCNAELDNGLVIKLIENTICVCKDGWQVIPKPLQLCAVMWITIIYRTLDIHVLKRCRALRCTGKVCIPPSGQ
jgi:hypothetical protein